jgi:predicted amidohydrolase
MIPERYATYEKVVTLGAWNMRIDAGDKKGNLARIEANLREAAAQGIDIVAFPEEALVGAGECAACRTEVDHCDYHQGLAETVPGPSTERIADLCHELDLYCAVGLAERDPLDSSRLYNAAAFIGPDGIQGTYRKLHLGSLPWVSEGVTFEPGDSIPIFETRFGPVGVIICYDFWFNPELTRLMALKGARMILNCCATFSGPGKREYMLNTTQVRAQENHCYVVSANHAQKGADASATYAAGGLDEGRAAHFLGHSTIAGPDFPAFSRIYAEAEAGEGLVSGTVSFEKLHRWQSVFPWRDWRATHQQPISRLIAEEFAKVADGS